MNECYLHTDSIMQWILEFILGYQGGKRLEVESRTESKIMNIKCTLRDRLVHLVVSEFMAPGGIFLWFPQE